MSSIKNIVKEKLLKLKRAFNKKKLPYFARNIMSIEKPKVYNISPLRYKKYKLNNF